MTLREKLNVIQTELKAPKNLYNKFGNYKYRNAEGILEAVKPLLKKTKTILLIEDEIICVGNSNNYEGEKAPRFYVMAKVILEDCESTDKIEVHAFARESATKKGQDESQITGSTSSYARKYALNGLFILDDTKDEDSEELHNEKENKEKTEKIKKEQFNIINELVAKIGMSIGDIEKSLAPVGAKKISDLTNEQAKKYITFLTKKLNKGA